MTMLADHYLIKDCCSQVKELKGDAAEIGVYQGDSAEVICDLLPESTVYLFDTYKGFPVGLSIPGVDHHQAGEFSDTSLRKVQDKLKAFKNARLIEGEFSQTCQSWKPSLKFVHIDCDLFLTTRDALEWCWPLLVSGGIVLNDDYGCASCAGAKKAVDEFAHLHEDCVVQVERHRAIIRRRTYDY